MTEVGNTGTESLARDNQKLVAQLEAFKADNAALKASHLAEQEALKVENEELRRRPVAVEQLPMSEIQEGLR